MKKDKIIWVAIVISISICCVSCITFSTTKGNGNLVSLKENVSAFEKINSFSSAEIRFHTSEEYQVVVTIDENLEEYVEIFTKNNALNIGTKSGSSISPTKFTIDIYCPVLIGVSMSGSGSFKNMDKIITSTFKSSMSGSGRMEGIIECDNYSAKISGSGKITVYGTVNNINISVSGSGNFNGSELDTKNATVAISGSGSANVDVSDNLKVRISGSGNVNYSGEPVVNSSISGSGRINKK